MKAWMGLHPDGNMLVDLSDVKTMRKCDQNPTHIDFYFEVQKKNERGTPDFTWVYDSQYDRDSAFEELIGRV